MLFLISVLNFTLRYSTGKWNALYELFEGDIPEGSEFGGCVVKWAERGGGEGVDGGFSVWKINHLPAPFCHQPLDSLYKAFQYSSKNDGSRSRLNHNRSKYTFNL